MKQNTIKMYDGNCPKCLKDYCCKHYTFAMRRAQELTERVN